MQCDAVILAAGSSTRFGETDKLAADLCGRPVLAWSLAAFEAAESIGRIVVVTGEAIRSWTDDVGRTWAPRKFAGTASGGERRRDSVESGLRLCNSRYVAIHDGARPLIDAATIDEAVAASVGRPGAIVAVPVTDTLKEVRDLVIVGHPDRSQLYAAQTPQVVLRQAWLDAAAAGDGDETDDAAMLARLGLECAVVAGSAKNFKITRPLDLELARLVLTRRGAR